MSSVLNNDPFSTRNCAVEEDLKRSWRQSSDEDAPKMWQSRTFASLMRVSCSFVSQAGVRPSKRDFHLMSQREEVVSLLVTVVQT